MAIDSVSKLYFTEVLLHQNSSQDLRFYRTSEKKIKLFQDGN